MAMTHEAQILGVDVRTTSGSPLQVVSTGDTFDIAMHVGFREEAPQPIFAGNTQQRAGRPIYDTTTQWQQQPTPDFSAGDEATIVFRIEANLLAGMYTVKVDFAHADLSCYYDYLPNAATFVVNGACGPRRNQPVRRDRDRALTGRSDHARIGQLTEKYDNTESVSSCRPIIRHPIWVMQFAASWRNGRWPWKLIVLC